MWPGPSDNQNQTDSCHSWQRGKSGGGGLWGLTIPYEKKIENGMQDKVITISAGIKLNPDKLTVDMMAEQDVVFHFNPRFKDVVDGKVVVMNSCLDGIWGHEERHFSPMFDAQFVEIQINCTSQGFKVQGNGCVLPIYKHRTNPSAINKIIISNDLTLRTEPIVERLFH